MKKSIKKFEIKALNNASTVKGGSIGRGTRIASGRANNRAELL